MTWVDGAIHFTFLMLGVFMILPAIAAHGEKDIWIILARRFLYTLGIVTALLPFFINFKV